MASNEEKLQYIKTDERTKLLRNCKKITGENTYSKTIDRALKALIRLKELKEEEIAQKVREKENIREKYKIPEVE